MLNEFFGGSNAPGPLYVDDVFSTYLYAGSGVPRSITNGIDLAGEGGLVWVKDRTNAGSFHALADTANGVGEYLNSNTTDPAFAAADSFTSFDSNGFSLGAGTSGNVNGTTNNAKYASWTFRKAPGFFDVVTYAGNGTAGRTIAHNLDSVPGMVIIKTTNGFGGWAVYHRSLGNGNALYLNSDGPSFSSSLFNNTTPTSTGFTVGSSSGVNTNGNTYVAYLFAHDDARFGANEDESIIKCGSFTTDGSSSATIDLGFEPQWLMYKRSDGGSEAWQMLDVMRGWTVRTSGANELYANSTSAETANNGNKPTSSGFLLDAGHSNNATYVYIAIRRPHKPPEAATDVFAIDTLGPPSPPGWNSGFVVDWKFQKTTTAVGDWGTLERITGGKLFLNRNDGGYTPNSNEKLDYNDGWSSSTATNSDNYSWMFRRAPGFFDMVAYTGDGTTGRNIAHNLGVTPELIILKSTNGAGTNWYVNATPYTTWANGYPTGFLNLTDAITGNTTTGIKNPTSTSFEVNHANTNTSNSGFNKYIAYLFASLTGISKVGSYTGTGSTLNVDCGFTAGARFVLIKRTDSTGDWYVWDSTRGIVSGNDPYLLINSDAVQVTSTDYIDPLNSGFTVTSSAPAALNASGGSYIFLAIA